MKQKILFLLFLFPAFILNGQEIRLKSAVTVSAGSNTESGSVKISKCKIGKIHQITLNRDEPNELSEFNWDVNCYPNPFSQNLNLNFQTEEINEFTIQVYDITGNIQWFNEEKTISSNQLISFDLAYLPPAIYLISITPKDRKTQQFIKVGKY